MSNSGITTNITRPDAEIGKGPLKAMKILDAATQLLSEEGYAALTMRGIASACGISVGNLQYHFKTKDALWKALLLREVERFEASQSHWNASKSSQGTGRALAHAVDYLLEDQKKSTSCALFRELWAVSLHDKDAANNMDQIYKLYTSKIAALAMDANPALSTSDAADRAMIIVSLIEGASLFRSGGIKPSGSDDIMREGILHTVLAIAAAGGTA